MTNPLTAKKCQPCEGIGKPLNQADAQKYLENTAQWEIDASGLSISRTFVTKNFLAAVAFIDQVAQVAEGEDHHPDIHLTGYRNLKIDLSTHAIGGLSENDFIVAAKINELPIELKT